MIGTTISHFKVLEKIGQGGMGEVYRAEDINLSRDVAIKVLPEQFTQDPQRLARFEREAKLLASLNHPNIAAIHSFEHADEIHFLVLELVEGETLAQKVAMGPLPVEESLEICRQIAEGVEAAHEKGVIHRDLKPANVKVTPEGQVKILDFGLAKAFEAEVPVTDISQSPTLTEEMTKAGVILGTAAYMSPEQAKGKSVDKRADVFAFGCVLYELLTASRAFQGETVTETLAKILEGEPNWDVLPPTLPSTIRFLMSRCLQKKPGRRLQHIDGARILIEEALSGATSASALGLPAASPPGWKRVMTVGLIALAAITTGISIWSVMKPVSPLLRPESITEFAILPPPDIPLTNSPVLELAISPDGRHIVYRAGSEGTIQLYLRTLGNQEAQAIPGTEGADLAPFFSPDGETIAFVAAGTLKRVGVTGGGPMTLGDAPTFRGGSWGPEDTIVFTASTGPGVGLYLISASGGEPKPLAIPDPDKGEFRFLGPQILPGGETVLFQNGPESGSDTWVVSLETGEKRIVLEGTRAARYATTGHLVYEAPRTGTLMAVPFDLEKLEVTGDPVSILEDVRHYNYPSATVDYGFSENGTLIYIPRQTTTEHELVWVDRQGTESLVTDEKRNYVGPRISPDGKQVAVVIFGENEQNIWIYDLDGDSFRRLTFEGYNGTPTWSPDGEWIVYQSRRQDGRALYRQVADGSGSPQQITEKSAGSQMANSWSPDGRVLAFSQQGIWMIQMEGEGKPQIFVDGSFLKFSPDGKWVAYIQAERGQTQIYVSPYSEPEVKWLVSGEEGGAEPVWAPDGSELFYRSGDKMMVVSVQTEPTLSSGRPRVLFEGTYFSSSISPGFQYYDISPDGQRFLMIKEVEAGQAQINVVLNWFEELKRLVPVNP